MARLSGNKVASGILRFLEDATTRCTKDGKREEAEIYDRAWRVVHAAFFECDPVKAKSFLTFTLQFPKQPSNACLLISVPDIAGPWWVDDRNGRQWVNSILTYLHFRAGTSWRSSEERFDPKYYSYDAAISLVNSAFNSSPPPQPRARDSAAAIGAAA